MIKFKSLALIASGVLAGSLAYAGDKACCAHGAGKDTKVACAATFAKLDLTAEQKTKMEAFAAECNKGGCTSESMAKMEKAAQGIMSQEQFAAWKAACAGKTSEKAQSS